MVTEQEVKEQMINDSGMAVFVYWDEDQGCYTATTANSGYMAETVGEAVEGAIDDEARYRMAQKEREQRAEK